MISLLCLAAATLVGNSPAISPIPGFCKIYIREERGYSHGTNAEPR